MQHCHHIKQTPPQDKIEVNPAVVFLYVKEIK